MEDEYIIPKKDSLLREPSRTTGTFQYGLLSESEKLAFDEVMKYLTTNGEDEVYATGSSLYDREHKSINILAVVSDAEEGVALIERIAKGIDNEESNSNRSIESYLRGGIDKLILNPKDEDVVPIDVTFITRGQYLREY